LKTSVRLDSYAQLLMVKGQPIKIDLDLPCGIARLLQVYLVVLVVLLTSSIHNLKSVLLFLEDLFFFNCNKVSVCNTTVHITYKICNTWLVNNKHIRRLCVTYWIGFYVLCLCIMPYVLCNSLCNKQTSFTRMVRSQSTVQLQKFV
jgi:hypothetical protein